MVQEDDGDLEEGAMPGQGEKLGRKAFQIAIALFMVYWVIAWGSRR